MIYAALLLRGSNRRDTRAERKHLNMDEIITPAMVAELLKIHIKTVYRLAEQGVIPGSRVGRSWRFSRKNILELVVAAEPASKSVATTHVSTP
jgi:excisionase family DNA binding protein